MDNSKCTYKCNIFAFVYLMAVETEGGGHFPPPNILPSKKIKSLKIVTYQ